MFRERIPSSTSQTAAGLASHIRSLHIRHDLDHNVKALLYEIISPICYDGHHFCHWEQGTVFQLLEKFQTMNL